MPTPSTSLATLRPELAGSFMEFDLEMDRAGFIWNQVLPVISVQKQSGKFGKVPIEELLMNRETKRGSSAPYSRSKWTFTDDSFATEEHGAEEPVDDRDAALYSDYFSAEQISAQRARDVVLRNAEKRVADAIFNTTTWTGASLTTAVTVAWSDVNNSFPIDDMEAATRKVFTGTGMWPNTAIMNRTVFRNLRLNMQIIDRIAGLGAGAATKSTDITAAMIAAVFDLERVVIADSVRNSAIEGQAASLGHIWSSTYVMVCRTARTNDIREPCLGRVMHWAEDGSNVLGTMESYRDETVRSDIIRCRHEVDEKVLYTEMGHLLSNIT